MSEKDRTYLSTVFRSVIDLERIGDYAENIVEYADKLKESGESFSSEAIEEITELKNLVNSLYDNVITAYKDAKRSALKAAYVVEEKVDKAAEEMTKSHIGRLRDGKCTPDAGTRYVSLVANAERVADHYINVAKCVF